MNALLLWVQNASGFLIYFKYDIFGWGHELLFGKKNQNRYFTFTSYILIISTVGIGFIIFEFYGRSIW